MALVVVAGLLYLHSSAFRHSIERRAEDWLTQQLGRETHLRLERLNPLTLWAEVAEVRIAGGDPGTYFIELDRGTFDLKAWPLLQRRIAVSSLSLDGLAVDLNQAPDLQPASPPTPLPSLAELLERVAIDRATLTGGSIRLGNASWPAEFDGQGLEASIASGPGSAGYRLRMYFSEGAARLAGGDWFAVEVSAEADLDPAGLRVDDMRLTAPGVRIGGRASLDDLSSMTGAVDAHGTFQLEALPWPPQVAPELRGDGTVDAEIQARFTGADVSFTARLTSQRLVLNEVPATGVDLRLSGADGAWTSAFELDVYGAQFSGDAGGPLTTELTPLEGRLSFSAADVATLAPLIAELSGVEPTSLRLRGRLQGSATVRAESWQPEGFEGGFSIEAADVGPRDRPDVAIESRVDGSFAAGELDLSSIAARGAGMSLTGTGRADLTRSSELDLVLRHDADAGDAISGLQALLEAVGVRHVVPQEAARLEGELTVTTRLRGPGLESLTLDSLGGQLTLNARGLTAARPDGLPVDADIELALDRGRVAVRAADLRGPGAQLALDGTLDTDTIDASIVFQAAQGTGARMLAELTALGLAGTVPRPVVERLGAARFDARLVGPWRTLSGTVRLDLTALGGHAGAEPRALTAEARLDRGALDAELRLDGGASFLNADLHAERYDRWPLPGSARFDGVEAEPGFWVGDSDLLQSISGRIAASGTVDLEAQRVQAKVGVTEGLLAGRAFELGEADLTIGSTGIAIDDARLIALGGELSIDGSLGGAGNGLTLRADSLEIAEIVLALGSEQTVTGTLTLEATLTGTLADPHMQATVATEGLAIEQQPLTDLAGDLAFAAGLLQFDLAGVSDPSARVVGEVRRSTPLSWSVKTDYPLHLDLRRLNAMPEGGPLDLQARIVSDLRGSGEALTGTEGRVEFQAASLSLGGDAFVPLEAPVVTLRDGRARLSPVSIDIGGDTLQVQAEIGLDPGGEISASVVGGLPLRSLSAQIPGARLEGLAELSLEIGGTVQRPVWHGEVKLKDGRLDHPDLPAPLERINADLTLTPDLWRFETFALQVGGGPITGSGTYRPATGERPDDLQLEIKGRGVRLPPIEGLRSLFDADVRLSGAPSGTVTLTGRLHFDRAVYETDIDLQRELLGKVRIVDTFDELGGVLDRVRLNLEIEAPGTLFVRNNLATLRTRTSLRIAGTAADPLVTGRVEIQEGGRVVFRNVTYNVERGTLDYNSDPPGDPRLDIEGRTSVGTYDISLLVSGTLEDPQIELTSTPPLSQADIVSLLVTGRTRDDLASSGAGMSETQAALYLGQGITREMEGTLARSLGLDQVTLDPMLIAAEDDPAARLTVGKALTGRLFATYSREFGGSQGDIYQLRFTPFERLSLLGQQNDEGEFLADAVYERKFYLGPERVRTAGSEAGTRGRVSRVTFEGVDALKEGRLEKALGLRHRDRFRRTVLLDGVEAIRELYLERGYPEANVDTRVDDSTEDVTVVVVVDEGRHVEVRANGPLGKKMKQAILVMWQQSVFRDEVVEDARLLALELLAARGYVQAQVAARLSTPSADEVELELDVDAGPRVHIDEIVIAGNSAIDQKTIRQQFLSLGESALRRDWLNPTLLAEDREAVRSLYFSRGYLDIRVDPPQVSYPRSTTRARVEILIDEGPLYALGGVRFSGNKAYDADRLRKVADLTEGRPYVDADVREARSRLRSFYDEHGYAGTQINVTRSPDRAAMRADLLFTVEEAPYAVIESIEINNPGLTRTHLISDKLEFEVGDPLSADEMARTRQELYRTGLFRSVTLVDEPGETTGGRRVSLTLDERSNVRTQTGLGYGTDQGVRGSVSISHSNLLGERLFGSVGARASATDWRVYGLMRQPDLFQTGLQGLATSSIEEVERESFDVRRKATSVQLEPGRPDRVFRWFVGYGVQEADIFRDGIEIDPGSGEVDLGELIDLRTDSPLLLADLNAGFTVGARDDFAWPTRGNLLNAKLAIFDSHLLSEAEFTQFSAQWSFYRPLGSGRIWSAGVRLGLAEPYGGRIAIPLSERFFVGGDNSIRGFRRDSIVAVGFPQQEFDDAGIEVTGSLGGEASLIINQELVVPFFSPVALVVFHDAGNLYWRRSDLDAGNLRHSAGLGLRVRTPVGPIRLEYGWKLDRQVDEDSGRLHFSIGVPF